MSGAMAFLAGMGAGYLSAKDKKLEQDRQAAQDKRQQDAFDMQKTTFDQNQADKATLRSAGAPVEVTPEQGPPTEAQYAATPAGQEPDAIGYRVGNGITAKDFATQGLAETAATQQNTPQGTQARQIAAMQATGDFAGAQKLRSETVKASTDEQNFADSTVRRSIGALKTHDDITRYMTDSPADKMGGNFSAKAVKGADGMIDYMQVLPDGTLKSLGQRFTDDAAGVEKARQTLAGYMTPEQRMVQAQHDITNGLAAKKEEREALESKAHAGYFDAYAEALRPGGTKDKSGSAVDRMSEYDKTTLLNINKQRDTIHGAITKGLADGSYDPNSPGAKALTTQMATLGLKEAQIQSKYGDTQAAPDPLGLKKPAATAATPARITPQQQQANDSDRPAILAAELQSAKARLAAGDPRAGADIDALNNEIARLPRVSGRPAAPTPRAIAATRVSAPVVSSPTLAPSAPALAAQGVQASVPTVKNDYAMQMAEANKNRLAKQAAQKAQEAADSAAQDAQDAQDKAVEAKRKAFVAARAGNNTTKSLLDTPINFSQR